jgi:hypothetical protein
MKKFTFGMAVLLSASLFLTGCPTEAADGSKGDDGRIGNGHIGATVSAVGLQAMIDSYVGTGAVLYLDGVTVDGGGRVDFKSVKAHVIGFLETGAGEAELLDLRNADITFEDATTVIRLGETSDAAIIQESHRSYTDTTNANNYAVTVANQAAVEALENLPVGNITAVANYALGDSGTALLAGLKVLVYDTLTVPDDSVAPANGASVYSVGQVYLQGDNNAAITALSDDTAVDVSRAEILVDPAITGNRTFTVTLPSSLAGPRFNLSTGHVVKVDSTDLSVDVQGDGTLELTDAVTAATITGKGNINFSNTAIIAFGAASHSITAQSITFAKGFTSPLTSVSNILTLSGKVVVKSTEKIKFGYAAGVVKLKAGSTLWNTESTPVKLLTADTDVTLSAAVTTTELTVAADGIGQAGTGGHTVTVTGEATLGAGATYTVASAASNVGKLTLVADAKLNLAPAVTTPAVTAAAKLVLTGEATGKAAILAGAGSVVAGATAISGGTNGWEAVGSGSTPSIIISADAISGTGTTPALTAVDATSAVTVAAGGTLTLTGAGITLATSKGKVTLKGGAKLQGTGSVAAGDTAITGGNVAGYWEAVGAATESTAITADTITSTANAVLTAGGHADAAITVAAEKTLTVTGGLEVVSTSGKVVLTGHATTPAKLKLALAVLNTSPAGKLIIDRTKNTPVTTVGSTANKLLAGSSSADTDANIAKDASGTVATAADVVLTADNVAITTPAKLAGSVAAGTSDAYIIGPGASKVTTIVTGNYFLGS